MITETGKTKEEMKTFGEKHKEMIEPIKEVRRQIKEKLKLIEQQEWDRKKQREIDIQQNLIREQHRMQMEQLKATEELSIRQQVIKEEWFKKKFQITESSREAATKDATEHKHQSVKLQKYTITPFEGDYKDWLRFWNQFEVEVDQSQIAEISKFNYLIELVKGKPKEDIMGLPTQKRDTMRQRKY